MAEGGGGGGGSTPIIIDYGYNHRKFLDSLLAVKVVSGTDSLLFREKLSYDSAGQIIAQESQNSSQSTPLVQNYRYDRVQRLELWGTNTVGDSTAYEYDEVGNRTSDRNLYAYPGKVYTYNSVITPNRLQSFAETIGGDDLQHIQRLQRQRLDHRSTGLQRHGNLRREGRRGSLQLQLPGVELEVH